MQTLFIHFGTREYDKAKQTLTRSIRRFGHLTRSYGEHSPAVQRAASENPEIFSMTKGYGLWLWKPYIILDAMSGTTPGTPIFYTDAGMTMVQRPERLLAICASHDVATFRTGAGTQQLSYTKADTFRLLNAESPLFFEDDMSNAAFLYLRNTERARTFVNEWLEAMRDIRILDDSSSRFGLVEAHSFQAHRHDQSVLSILATKHQLPVFRDPSQYGRESIQPRSQRFLSEDFGQVFDHHRRPSPKTQIGQIVSGLRRRLLRRSSP